MQREPVLTEKSPGGADESTAEFIVLIGYPMRTACVLGSRPLRRGSSAYNRGASHLPAQDTSK